MNHYEVLGISKNATPEEIKDAYKDLVKKYHPDIYAGDKTYAEKRTKEINIAYDVLSDPKSKEAYDLTLAPKSEFSTPSSSTVKTSGGYSYTVKPIVETKKPYVRSEAVKNSAYSYENYKKNFKTTSSYYDPSRRYTDYHRSKVPNSNYSTKTNLNDDSLGSLGKIELKNKFALFFIAIILYIVFSLITFSQVSVLLKSPPSYDKPSTDTNTLIENSSSKKEFNIYDYFTQEELRDMYNSSFKDAYPNYQDFIDDLSEVMIETYF